MFGGHNYPARKMETMEIQGQQIRPMTDADTFRVSEILTACYRQFTVGGFFPEAEVQKLIDTRASMKTIRDEWRDQPHIVATRDDTVQGVVVIRDNEIARLYVAPDSQRTGLGRALFEAAEEEIRKAGHDTLVVGVLAWTAKPFFKTMGLAEGGDRKISTGPFQGREIALMGKRLRQGSGRLPTVRTKRLVLRQFAAADAPEVQKLAGDKDVASKTASIPYPYKDGAAENWINSHPDTFEQGDGVTLAVTRGDDKVLLGAISLAMNKAHQRAEIGFWIGKPFWKSGYCTEAAAVMIEYAFIELGVKRVVANVYGANPGAARVLRKVGMRHEGTLRRHIKLRGEYCDVQIFGILGGEFHERRQGK